MVPEFDQVVFSADVNEVQGPVKTQFGYHLLEVTSRTD
jgi:peptidyl-prolyl cis-trans isomerase C